MGDMGTGWAGRGCMGTGWVEGDVWGLDDAHRGWMDALERWIDRCIW